MTQREVRERGGGETDRQTDRQTETQRQTETEMEKQRGRDARGKEGGERVRERGR